MAAIGSIPALGAVDRLAATTAPGSIGQAASADPLAIGGLGAPGAAGATTPASAPGTSSGPGQSFLDMLGSSFGQLNQQLVTADLSLADFAAGGSSDLHTVMLQMQEASLGLKLGVQVRDKFLEAYQEIMRLQV
jgi:flagellar hook-basal body complex protein FliE